MAFSPEQIPASTEPTKRRWSLWGGIALLGAGIVVWWTMRVGELPPATKEAPFENSLGMKFVPAGTDGVLFGIWDVRVKDYDAFIAETGRQHFKPEFDQGPEHPVVKVNWYDAKAFCQWLTEKDRKAGKIKGGVYYRLPEGKEWDAAVGDTKYPWGNDWPPPKGAGNFNQDLSVDEFENTSPVGSFAANRYGLFDMGGNVCQWTEDLRRDDLRLWERLKEFVEKRDVGVFYRKEEGVLCGESWIERGLPQILQSSSRAYIYRTSRYVGFGFRCVLVGSPSSR